MLAHERPEEKPVGLCLPAQVRSSETELLGSGQKCRYDSLSNAAANIRQPWRLCTRTNLFAVLMMIVHNFITQSLLRKKEKIMNNRLHFLNRANFFERSLSIFLSYRNPISFWGRVELSLEPECAEERGLAFTDSLLPCLDIFALDLDLERVLSLSFAFSLKSTGSALKEGCLLGLCSIDFWIEVFVMDFLCYLFLSVSRIKLFCISCGFFPLHKLDFFLLFSITDIFFYFPLLYLDCCWSWIL